MSLLLQDSVAPRPGEELKEASRALESMLLKQMLTSSGAFKGSEMPGSSMHADLFVEALADAVVKAGGLGLGESMLASLNAGGAPSPATEAVSSREPPHLHLPREPGITSGFGLRRDPFTGQASPHHGIDVSGKTGEPIVAAAEGVVVFAGQRGGYGNVVEVEHAGGVRTLYAHASELSVKEGERVSRGQAIARVGETGRATGPHLHFEVRVQGKPVDPVRALKAYGIRAEELSREVP